MSNTRTNRKSLAYTIGLFLLTTTYGASYTMIGPLMPDLLSRYGLNLAGGGVLVSVQNIAGLIAIVLCGIYGDRLDKKRFIVIGVFLFMVGLLGVGGAPPYALLLSLFFVFGLGSRAFDTLSNAVISDIHGEKRSLFLNLLHTFFSVGAFLGPLYIYGAERWNVEWRFTFLVLGIVVAGILIFFVATGSLRKDPEAATNREAAKSSVRGFAYLFGRGNMWALGFIMFLHMGVQGIIITWLPLYFRGDMGAGVFLSHFSLSVFWAGMILSRLLVSRAAVRFGEIFMIRWGGVVALFFFIPALAIGNPILLAVGSGFLGLFIGYTIPFAMTIACGWYPENSAAATSMLFVFGFLSIIVYPWASGLLGDVLGLYAAMVLVAVSQAVLFVVTWFIKKN